MVFLLFLHLKRLRTDSIKMRGRIFFPGNPWPEGHRVKSFKWTAFIHPQYGGYNFDGPQPGPAMAIAFELVSEDYYEADGTHLVGEEEDDPEQDEWGSKIPWNNYHQCWIGESRTSSAAGIPVSDGTRPFAFDQEEYHFSADPLPVNWDNFFDQQAFGIYLLGHDAVADHKIHLHSRQPDGSYTLDWTGKVARYYKGETDFVHDFIARVEGVKFDSIVLWYFDPVIAKDQLGIEMNPSMTPRDYIAPFVADPDRFRFEKRNGILHAVYMA